MSFFVYDTVLAGGLFFGMLLLLEAGRRYGVVMRTRDPEGWDRGSGTVDAAVFSLLGLLLAFTFSSAAARFEQRRHLITQEANAIGTAYLRLDLLPTDTQPEMRQLFARYLDTRTSVYRNIEDAALTQARIAEQPRSSDKSGRRQCPLRNGRTLSVAFFVILDLEYPRYGLIRIDEADELLAELRSLMQEAGE
jgi:hypothetical protein